jgi:hypothetical protein
MQAPAASVGPRAASMQPPAASVDPQAASVQPPAASVPPPSGVGAAESGVGAPAGARAPVEKKFCARSASADVPLGERVSRASRGELYDRIGAAYARHRRADPRVTRALLDALGLPTGARVVDIRAGAGAYARELADSLRRPVRRRGVEPARALLAEACPIKVCAWPDRLLRLVAAHRHDEGGASLARSAE